MAKRIREVRQAAILRANAFRCDVYPERAGFFELRGIVAGVAA